MKILYEDQQSIFTEIAGSSQIFAPKRGELMKVGEAVDLHP